MAVTSCAFAHLAPATVVADLKRWAKEMTHFGYYLWLGKQAFSFVTYLWFVSVPLMLLFVCFSIYGARHSSAEEKKKMKWLPLLFLFPAVHLLLGVIFEKYGAQWPGYLNYALFFSIVPVGVGVLIRFKGLRIATVSCVLLTMWLSFCAGLVAGMSISGDWL